MKLRFAPSPTGLLHVGNARQALANALYARRHGGQFQLRIDDTDIGRSREELVEAIQKDLRWMGIQWDETFRQTERLDRYAAAIEKLKASGHLYPCFESEQELAAKRETQIRQRRAPVYDRAMLKMTPQQRAQAEANGKVPYWRFKLSNTTVRWRDMVMGDCQVKLPSVSDPVLVRTDGTVLYTLASVVDDLETGITHIIRGEDHVTNTGVQIDIAQALGAHPDHFRFAHLPLLLDENGGKLSKRFDACSLRTFRQDGIEATALISYLARLGSSDDPVLLPFDEQAKIYDISHISRSAARFDTRQLLAMNHKLLAQTPYADVADRLPKGATEAFWLAIRGNIELLSEARLWHNVTDGDIIPPVQEGEDGFLKEAASLLPPEPWDETTWKAWTTAVREKTGRSGKALFHPLRLALTGEEQGPELRDLLPLIGRSRALARLLPSA
ncbi:glutamate--tRNA ligase [Acetobacter pasteurianus]|uniref:Glutamate--tRNA ligase n=3 Tax=Acetobacter pasteurianus TaxID=438 RepID=A0A401WV15_ACEPA|nr:glutamate--tRNA ligase [Acetobacter pasteurianus]BAI00043.1 glutamyl-tRNA synthetase [Acetobacter pasteurianus IFO 3283-01]BAI03096.1 glutamyl-tRNA synthetase [Acetobacter pasteurianus IFO 3283-03]BAI06141.1 glutamyl-tRNA synthetase [Acetobacter pasteurianus IFO 3283-07]BAI09191.1 glutamyl-tRNA synthetase [Acetobacter pasteurianus IFO 3283-22]BAI12239.1 glutamyl-tRNA synthetase [Acetobacter pasteurianus IFO 3283-26]